MFGGFFRLFFAFSISELVFLYVLMQPSDTRCQSVKVKVSNSLWHFMREGWLLTDSLKEGLFSWKLQVKVIKIIINNNIYNIIIIYNILYIIINHIKCRISPYDEMQFDTLTLTL